MSKQGRWDEMGELITDEILEQFAVVGEPEAVARGIGSRYGALIDRIGRRTGGLIVFGLASVGTFGAYSFHGQGMLTGTYGLGTMPNWTFQMGRYNRWTCSIQVEHRWLMALFQRVWLPGTAAVSI